MPETEVVYRDRTITKRDTVYAEREPRTRIIYRTHTDTVRVPVTAPRGLRIRGLISRTPIEIRSRRAILTYFDPESSRWVQNIYTLPRARSGAYIAALYEYDLREGHEAGLRLGARHRRVAAHLDLTQRSITAGLTVRITGNY